MAYGGHEVRVHDQSSNTLNKITLRINEDKRILKEDGLITHTNFLVINEIFVFDLQLNLYLIFFQGEVYCFTRLEDAVREAEFIFECVAEDIGVKQNIFKRIDNNFFEFN